MRSFPVINPATGATVGEFPATRRWQAVEIIGRVHAAFLRWERTSFPKRAERMHGAAAALLRQGEPAALVTREIDKTIREAEEEEVEKCATCCDYFAERAFVVCWPFGVVQSGAAFVNAGVHSVLGLPFGGIKNSGYGRELSRHGILEFFNVKTDLVRG